jgi:nitronate monooxygenase
MLRTRFTQLLGIERPIMGAPMAMHSGGTLAAAVSQAGGLGSFGGIHFGGPDWVREQIRYVRSQTDGPFGVGFITHFLPAFEASFAVVIEERVPIVAFSFADPQPWLGRAKEAGATTVGQVQTLAAARTAVTAGADVLVAQGNEAGGHTGTTSVLSLLAAVRDAYPDMPVLAAGGIGNGRALAAVLAAGADGAWLGTALLATNEAVEVSDAHKQRIVESDGTDTVYTEVFDIVDGKLHASFWPEGIAGRVYRNAFAQQWHGREDELRAKLDEVAPAVAEAAERRDPERTALHFGPAAAAVDRIRPAADVITRICDDAERILRERPAEVLA